MAIVRHPPDVSSSAHAAEISKRQRIQNAIIACIVFLGILIASYPAISQWFTAHERADQITGYSESLERVGPDVLHDVLNYARQYNRNMPGVLVSDPYSLSDARDSENGAWENYQGALSIPGSDVMATIRIPSIHVALPIRHGTSDAVLAEGAGHLFGSSLPVGGERAHAVITAHTALSRATLFDDLNLVELGEYFHIDVAGETLTYRVDAIDVVLPDEVESLQLESGRDLVTLVTCAPPTVNTHRLLVRGERVHLQEEAMDEGHLVNVDGTEVGFPWWMLWLGGSAGVILFFTLRTRKSTPNSDASDPTTR